MTQAAAGHASCPRGKRVHSGHKLLAARMPPLHAEALLRQQCLAATRLRTHQSVPQHLRASPWADAARQAAARRQKRVSRLRRRARELLQQQWGAVQQHICKVPQRRMRTTTAARCRCGFSRVTVLVSEASRILPSKLHAKSRSRHCSRARLACADQRAGDLQQQSRAV